MTTIFTRMATLAIAACVYAPVALASYVHAAQMVG
jgi:hypothetical protein